VHPGVPAAHNGAVAKKRKVSVISEPTSTDVDETGLLQASRKCFRGKSAPQGPVTGKNGVDGRHRSPQPLE
jgi:hypothetical protein